MNGQVSHSNLSSQSQDPTPTPVYLFGWGVCKSKWVQKVMNNAKAFLVLLTLANVMQGLTVNGLLKVNVTSIERRFNLLSSESGLIISAYDIAGCLSLLPISYLGGHGHKPRWIGIGLIITSLGTIMLALPHFLTGPYVYSGDGSTLSSNSTSNLCQQSSVVSRLYPSNVIMYNNSETEACLEEKFLSGLMLPLNQMKYVFLFGQFVIGIGSTPLAVLSITFIDESVDPPVYPLYIGIYYMGALIGPALGFIVGGQLLNVFTEIGVTPENLTPDSLEWVGAWWLGFVISAICMFVIALPVLAYPRKLPSTFTRKTTLTDIKGQYSCNRNDTLVTSIDSSALSANEEEYRQIKGKSVKGNQVAATTEQAIPLQSTPVPEENTCGSPNDARDSSNNSQETHLWEGCEIVHKFFTDFVIVITNKAFISLSLAAAVLGTIVSGFSTFGPKFIESQFSKSASDAANLFGYVCIPAAAGGMMVGSFLMSGLKLGHKSSLRMCLCVSVVGLFALFALTLHCDDIPLAGVNVPYSSFKDDDETMPLTSLCNANCTCSSNRFRPVCGGDGLTYFSPCYASCSSFNKSSANVYANCSCISLPESTTFYTNATAARPDFKGDVENNVASLGRCPSSCQWRDVILAGLFFVISTTFVCAVPGADLSLRCFPQELRSLSVGIQWIIIRTLGTIPGPIVFGAMIDGSCLVWSKQDHCTDGVGSCMMYSNQGLSFSLLVLSLIFKIASIVFFVIALGTYRSARFDAESSPSSSRRLSAQSPL